MSSTLVHGRDLTVGDAVEFAGRYHVLTRFEPYTGALLPVLGAGTRIAWAEPDWSITLPPSQLFTATRPASAAGRSTCTYCGDAIVCYVGGRWIGAETDTRQCTGRAAGVLHSPR